MAADSNEAGGTVDGVVGVGEVDLYHYLIASRGSRPRPCREDGRLDDGSFAPNTNLEWLELMEGIIDFSHGRFRDDRTEALAVCLIDPFACGGHSINGLLQ